MMELSAVGSSVDLHRTDPFTAMQESAIIALRSAVVKLQALDRQGETVPLPQELTFSIRFDVNRWDLQAHLRLMDERNV